MVGVSGGVMLKAVIFAYLFIGLRSSGVYLSGSETEWLDYLQAVALVWKVRLDSLQRQNVFNLQDTNVQSQLILTGMVPKQDNSMASKRMGLIITTSIIIAGTAIFSGLFFGLRWQISASSHSVYRLDRWTGEIVECYVPQDLKELGYPIDVSLRYHCQSLSVDYADRKKLPTVEQILGPSPIR